MKNNPPKNIAKQITATDVFKRTPPILNKGYYIKEIKRTGMFFFEISYQGIVQTALSLLRPYRFPQVIFTDFKIHMLDLQ